MRMGDREISAAQEPFTAENADHAEPRRFAAPSGSSAAEGSGHTESEETMGMTQA